MKIIDTITNKKIHCVYVFVIFLLIFLFFFITNQVKSIPLCDDDDDGAFSSADESYELIITSPNEGETFDINEITLEWELLPPSCLIYIIYKVQVDNQAFIDVGTDTSYHFSDLEDGQRTLRVYGFTDQKIYSDSVNIKINTDDKGETPRDEDDDDYEEPKIEITSPNEGDIFHVNEVTLQWELTNSESCNLDYYEVRILESESWINVGMDNSYQFTNLEEGEITLQVRAIDENGNIGSTDSVTITIDIEDYEEIPTIGNGETTNPPSTDGDDDDDDDNDYDNNDNIEKKSNNKNDAEENQNDDTNNKEKTVENGPIALFTHEEEQNSQTKSNFKLPSLIGSITNLKIPEISWIIVVVIISLSIVILLIYLIKSKNIYLINKI